MINYAEVLKIVFILLGSTVLTALINAWFNRKKTNAEIESLVVNNYREIVDDLRQEIVRMKDRISDVEKKERLYIEQSNLLIKDKQELSIRILQLEKDNKYLFEENVKLKKALQDLNVNK